ncbi:MAG TPA: FtsQ-type POTRA domain-containing protein [Candidatus Dormibacteraeota bacterium]|nr:FtsQ-type POTRA domain-containing protein [Candidatus Dormibacteraeota bacterium]
MKLRRRRSVLPRVGWRRDLQASEPLKGQLWTRSEKSLREPDVHWARRALAGLVAVALSGLLAWLWFGPPLSVRTVQVTGAQHLTSAQVAQLAGLAGGASVLSVDAQSDRSKLLNQTWVQAATVIPQLPGSVLVEISEWQPVAVYHSGTNPTLFLMSDQAVILAPAPSAAGLVDVQGPSGADPKVGQRPIEQVLVTAIVNLQRGFPALLGQQVSGFIFDSCGNLTLIAKKGWKVYFGRVLTPEEFVTLHDKVAALKAIQGRGNVNYNSTDLEYVNVMNPTEPAVGYRSRLNPPTPSPSPGASPRPSPSPSPKPSPTPAPICK